MSTDRWMVKDVAYIHTYTHNGILDIKNENEILPFVIPWMDLESIMLSEISQRKTNFTVWSHLYLESKLQN